MQLRKEKPPDAGQGVLFSSRKEENDDLHVNTGECHSFPSAVVGDPSPKLKS